MKEPIMKQYLKMLIVCMLASMTLAGCMTAGEKLTESGATPYTKEELTTTLSGMTEVWTEGGAYYAPDGSLETLWKGVKESGTLEITEAGEVCWHVASWGKQPCAAFYHSADGSTVTVYKGKTDSPSNLQMGNTVDSL